MLLSKINKSTKAHKLNLLQIKNDKMKISLASLNYKMDIKCQGKNLLIDFLTNYLYYRL